MKKIVFLSINILVISWYNSQEKLPSLKQDLKLNEVQSINKVYPLYKILTKKVDSGYYMLVKNTNYDKFSVLKSKSKNTYRILPSPIISDTIK